MSFCVSFKLKELFCFPIIIVSAIYFKDFYSLIKKFIYILAVFVTIIIVHVS